MDAAGRDTFEIHGRRVSIGEERRKRVSIINRVLGHYGVSIRDWGGNSYVIADKSGRNENIYDLGGIWREADRLSERPCDPLDPALIDALRAASDAATRP